MGFCTSESFAHLSLNLLPNCTANVLQVKVRRISSEVCKYGTQHRSFAEGFQLTMAEYKPPCKDLLINPEKMTEKEREGCVCSAVNEHKS